MLIEGKTVLVTGSTGKLGSEIVLELARQGCNCICHYNSNAFLASELIQKVEACGVKAWAVQADLSDPQSCEKLFELSEGMEKVSVLINSASVFERKPLSEVDSADIQRVMQLNFASPLMLSKLFAVNLGQDSDGVVGKIVNIGDVAGELSWANYSVYCASKSALASMTRSLAKELAPRITINSVSPGIVSWPEGFEDSDKLYQIEKIPMGRRANFREITESVVFLLKNDYITGQVLNVDGGRSL